MEYGSFQAEEFGDLQRLVDGLFYDRTPSTAWI